jgi:LytS/YehU family sensor histidine kinase
MDTPVPPMILLPLAENSVKHGPASGHRGDISFAVSSEAGGLKVTILNPGKYRGPRPGSDGVPTVAKRLEVAYGARALLHLKAQDEGTLTTVLLPAGGLS